MRPAKTPELAYPVSIAKDGTRRAVTRLLHDSDFFLRRAPTTALRLGQNFDGFHVMTRLTDRHKTIPYFKRVLVSSDTWGRSIV